MVFTIKSKEIMFSFNALPLHRSSTLEKPDQPQRLRGRDATDHSLALWKSRTNRNKAMRADHGIDV